MSEEGRTDLIDDSEIKICIKTCTVLLERVYLELLLFIELKIEMFILNLWLLHKLINVFEKFGEIYFPEFSPSFHLRCAKFSFCHIDI